MTHGPGRLASELAINWPNGLPSQPTMLVIVCHGIQEGEPLPTDFARRPVARIGHLRW